VGGGQVRRGPTLCGSTPCRSSPRSRARLGDVGGSQDAGNASAGTFQKRFAEVVSGTRKQVYLYERGERRGGGNAALRPNQLFALSLPFPSPPEAQVGRGCWAAVEEKLYTPCRPAALGAGSTRTTTLLPITRVRFWGLAARSPFYSALVRVHGAGRPARRPSPPSRSCAPRLVEAGVASLSPEVLRPRTASFSPAAAIARACGVGGGAAGPMWRILQMGEGGR